MKTCLGIWALGSMITRFVPGGYQPQWADETTAERVRRAVDGLGDLIDGYEFHYPQELSEENLDEVRGRSASMTSTASRRPAPRSALRPRRARHPRPATAPRPCDRRRGGDFAGELGAPLDRLARDRGLQLPVPDAVQGELGVVRRGHRPGRRDVQGGRGRALARAQELRAGDEDPHAQHRDDAARHPHAARPGNRQRQGEHGLAAPDHERREPGRIRGAALRRGPDGPPSRELGLGHVRRRQHGRRDRVHGDARARRRAAAGGLRRGRRAARLRSLPVHGGRGRGGEAKRAAVALHRRDRGPDRRRGPARGADAQGRGRRLRARLRSLGA